MHEYLNYTFYGSKEDVSRFNVTLAGSGYELVVGSLTQKIAEYLKPRWSTFIGDYCNGGQPLCLDMNDNEIDPEFKIERWHECDDVAHENGPVVEKEVTVFVQDEDGETIFQGTVGCFLLGGTVQRTKKIELIKGVPQLAVFRQEEYRDVYPISVKGRFDVQELRFEVAKFNRTSIITGISYDGESYEFGDRDYLPVNDDQSFAHILTG